MRKPFCVLGAPPTDGAGCPCTCAWHAQTPLCTVAPLQWSGAGVLRAWAEVKHQTKQCQGRAVVQTQAVHAHVAPCFEVLPDPLPDWSEEAAGSGASLLVDAVLRPDQMTHTHTLTVRSEVGVYIKDSEAGVSHQSVESRSSHADIKSRKLAPLSPLIFGRAKCVFCCCTLAQTPSPTANGKLEGCIHVPGVVEGRAWLQHAPHHLMGLRGLHHSLGCTCHNTCLFSLEAKTA